MEYKISGDNLQLVTLQIDPNDIRTAKLGAIGIPCQKCGAMIPAGEYVCPNCGEFSKSIG